MTQFILLRHGQVTEEKHLLGHTDWPVMPCGFEAMKDQASNLDIDLIVSSPLARCLDFAQELSAEKHIELLVNHHLAEINFGDWDGEKIETLWQEKQELISHYFSKPFDYTPPNAENALAFQQRVQTAIIDLHKSYTDKTILIVCHAGVIKAAIASALKIDHQTCNWLTSLQIDYASLHAISYWSDIQENDEHNATVHYFNRIHAGN